MSSYFSVIACNKEVLCSFVISRILVKLGIKIKCRFFEFKPWNSEVLVIAVLSFWYIIRSLKQRCFWAMDVNQKWGLFPFDMPWQYHICIAKCLYSYRDYLPENLDKTTIGSLSIDNERDDNDELFRERTGSRMSLIVGKFES